jgi:hypothetical protein
MQTLRDDMTPKSSTRHPFFSAYAKPNGRHEVSVLGAEWNDEAKLTGSFGRLACGIVANYRFLRGVSSTAGERAKLVGPLVVSK